MDRCIACEIGTLVYRGESDWYECDVCGFREEEFERARRLAVGQVR